MEEDARNKKRGGANGWAKERQEEREAKKG